MPIEEELRFIGTFWEDISEEKEKLESPEWHQKALQEAEYRVNAGKDEMIDWETAKKLLGCFT